jgi:hypothetical protein
MTDRIQALTVALDRDIRADEIEPLVSAIRMLRWVINVTPEVVDTDAFVARSRADHEVRTSLWEALNAKRPT